MANQLGSREVAGGGAIVREMSGSGRHSSPVHDLVQRLLSRSPSGRVAVLVSGPSGSGKSSVSDELVARADDARVAGTDIDDAYLERFLAFSAPDVEDGWALARRDTGRTARRWLLSDRRLVFIGGNSLFHPDQVMDVLPALASVCEVHHVTLTPSLATIRRNIAGRGDHPRLAWVEHDQAIRLPHIDHRWTFCIDNSELTVAETLKRICERVADVAEGISEALLTPTPTGDAEPAVA